MTGLSIIRRFMAAGVIAWVAVAGLPAVLAQSPPAEALFIRASVDNDRPYLGQQVTYSLRIYQRKEVDLSSVRVTYRPPGFAGFWNSQQTRQDEYDESVGNGEYRVVEVRTVLFASVVGPGEIEPAVLEFSTGGPGTSGRLESAAMAVEVRPLPVPEPEGFTGAVGTLEVSASADTADGRLNEPVSLTVIISGEGNIEALPDPEWPEFSGWRVIESPVSSESQVVAGVITGSRAYEFTLVPKVEGELIIPEIRYPHFDPAAEQYVQVGAALTRVSVAGVDGAAPPQQHHSAEIVEDAETEFRPIKGVSSSLRRGGGDLTDSRVYWAAWAVPALIIAGAVAWRRGRTAQEAARAEAQRRRALPDAQALLARARASGGDTRIASSNALLSYISARLETELNGLTREALLRTLRGAGVSQDLEDRVSEVLAAGESARYTPETAGPSGTSNYADRASRLLDELEEAINA